VVHSEGPSGSEQQRGPGPEAGRWVAERLRERGIRAWLDEAELRLGRGWQDEAERQIGTIKAAAVFVGPSGLGPWQNREMRALLQQFVEQSCAVIPVLLPGASMPALPLFLRDVVWVDLRTSGAAEMDRLVWGITGQKLRRRARRSRDMSIGAAL
jgi:hypothetical protein